MAAKVEIYSKTFCPYCTAAKAMLDGKGVQYTEYKVDEDEEKLKEMLERTDGRTTVPEIFINDELIGGFDDLKALDQDGKLDEKLQ